MGMQIVASEHNSQIYSLTVNNFNFGRLQDVEPSYVSPNWQSLDLGAVGLQKIIMQFYCC